MGSRVTSLLSEHPEVVDYFGRALLDGSPLGITIFDTPRRSARRVGTSSRTTANCAKTSI
jgi:hypothetical protein